MPVGKACHILISLLVVWMLWPAPNSRAGVIVPYESQGTFDFVEAAVQAINYANAYLKHQAIEQLDTQQLSLWGSSKVALDNLERQLQQVPGDLELQTALGVTLFGASREREAQHLFEQTVSANQSYAIGHCYLAYLTFLEGGWSNFERHFELAIQADPTYVPAYNSLAMFYAATGNVDAALRILTQGIARFPNEASLVRNQALVYAKQERWDAAEASLRNALMRQPTEHNSLWLGLILLKGAQYERAQTVFESILATNPKNTFALAGLADTYKGRHDFSRSIRLIKQAIVIEPTNKDLHDELRIHEEAYRKWQKCTC